MLIVSSHTLNHWNLELNNLPVTNYFAVCMNVSGGFSVVYLGTNKKTGQKAAVKKIKKSALKEEDRIGLIVRPFFRFNIYNDALMHPLLR